MQNLTMPELKLLKDALSTHARYVQICFEEDSKSIALLEDKLDREAAFLLEQGVQEFRERDDPW